MSRAGENPKEKINFQKDAIPSFMVLVVFLENERKR